MDITKKIDNYLTEWNLPLYGGLPTVGGYQANTEYEIGAQRIVEAVHCILGSISRMRDMSDLRTEKSHIEEEMDNIKGYRKEYSRPLYINRLKPTDRYYQLRTSDSDSKYPEYIEATFKSIRTNSLKLINKAKTMMNKLDKNMPKEIRDVCVTCYKLVITIAETMMKSIKNIDRMYNAFDERPVKIAVDLLEINVNKLFEGDR